MSVDFGREGAVISPMDILASMKRRSVSPGPQSLTNISKKADKYMESQIPTSKAINASLIVRRLSTRIGDYMTNSAYQKYRDEVSNYLNTYGGANKDQELSMFRTLFKNEAQTTIQLPLTYDYNHNSVCSDDSCYMAVWNHLDVTLISIVRAEIVFTLKNLIDVKAVFISPDSLFLVVIEKKNIRIFTVFDEKECFNLSAHGAMSHNPFETQEDTKSQEINIERIKFSFMNQIEGESYASFHREEADGEENMYKLIFGDKSLIYVVDISLVEHGVNYLIEGKLEKFNLQDYFLLESSEYLFTYQERSDSREKYIVAVTESKGSTRIRRWRLEAMYSEMKDEYRKHNKVILQVDREDTLQGSFTFQYAERNPFRVGGHYVAVFNNENSSVYKCNLSTPFGFVGAEGAHALMPLYVGFATLNFKQIIISELDDYVVSSHESLEMTVWKREEGDWNQQYLDTNSKGDYNMRLTPNAHFLLVKNREGVKILPLGFELVEKRSQIWVPEIMNAPPDYKGFTSIKHNTVIVDDMNSAFLLTFSNKPKVKPMFDFKDGLVNPKIKEIVAIIGTNDYWILVTDSLSFTDGSNYRLFLYNSNTGRTKESNVDIPSVTLRVRFNFDGKYVFLGDGPEGNASQVDRVRIYSYESEREILVEFINCTCVVIKQYLYLFKEDLIRIIDLETKSIKKDIDNINALCDIGLETKVYLELGYIVVYGLTSLSVIDYKSQILIGGLKKERLTDVVATTSPFTPDMLAITKNKELFIAGDKMTGEVVIHNMSDFNLIAEFKMSFFDSICVSPDSKYLFIAFDFEKQIVVYSLKEYQIRTVINTDFDFLGTGAYLKHVGFADDGNHLVLYYLKDNCVSQVQVPFGQVTAFNAMFRIYPTILRYFSTGSFREKDRLTQKILDTLVRAGKHVPQLLHIFTIAIYHLDQPGFFKKYVNAFMSMDELCQRHGIWRLALHTFKVNSMKCFTEMFQEYISRYHSHPYIDEMAVRDFITDKNQYLSNTLYRYLLKKLLFWRMESEYIGELRDPFTTAAYVGQSANRSDAVEMSIQSLLKKHPYNLTSYTSTEALVTLDFGNGSDFSATFFEIVNSLPESEIRDYYYVFVHYKWNKIFKFALIYSVIYWIMNMMAYLYCGFYFNVVPLGITLSILNILFLLFELKCASADYRRYLSSAWNWVDLVIHSLSIATVYSLMGADHTNVNQFLAWLRVVNVLVLSIRGITMLRVFKGTRYLISMLMQVLLDVIPFLVVLGFVILIYIYIWFVIVYFGLDVDGTSGNNFYISVQLAVFTFFGQFETNDLNTFQFVMITLGNIILALILGNFIIALISATYERISEQKELYDVKDVISMISDFDAFLKGLIRRHSHIWKSYISLFPKYERSEDLRKTVNAIQSCKDDIVLRIAESNNRSFEIEKKIARLNETLESRVKEFETALDTKLDRFQKKIEDIIGIPPNPSNPYGGFP